MIIECEKCKTKFNLDESLLTKKGSKVQCSVCKDIFKVYLEKPTLPSETEAGEPSLEDIGEGISSNEAAPPEKKEPDFLDEQSQEAFERAFEEAEDEDTIETSLVDEVSEEEFEIEQALEREDKEGFDGAKERVEDKIDDRPIKSEKVRNKGKSGPSGPFLVILLIILILLGGSAVVYFIAPQFIPNSLTLFKFKTDKGVETIDPGASRLSFKGVTGSFVQSPKEGQLFVIKGMVANDYNKSRSFILVKGTILDDKAQVAKRKLAYAGNTIPEKQIQAMTMAQINVELKNRPGKGNINVDVAPNRAIPFMVVLGDLPEDLSEFTVEAVSSSPGK